MRREKYYVVIAATTAVCVFAIIAIIVAAIRIRNTYFVLVNVTNSVPEKWEEKIVLDTVKNAFGEEVEIEHQTYIEFRRLRSRLLEQEGIQIEPVSGYRSAKDEAVLAYQLLSDEYPIGYAAEYAVVPGFGEHQTGLAIDIAIVKDGQIIRDIEDLLADTEDFAKIHALLPEYGFILRYPEDKQDITHTGYEPWHIRFINSPESAKEIARKQLTLEEYLGKVK